MATLVVITGPTAVGKTALCIKLAKHYGIPIINADSRQIYRELRIGTASPSDEQLREVKHYFVGSIGIDDYYNASLYEQDVLRVLDEQFCHSPIQLLTGGSMMYIDDDIRNEMKRRYTEEGLEALCADLQRLDPEHYAVVDRKNYRRVIHALEICYQTGQTYTSFRKQERKQRPFRIVKIGLNRERDELYQRINSRVDQMMTEGLLDEARSLYDKRSNNALNTVGYKEMFAYLDSTWTLDEAIERMKGNTRRYARKQLTWFRRDTEMQWFHPKQQEDILNYISKYE